MRSHNRPVPLVDKYYIPCLSRYIRGPLVRHGAHTQIEQKSPKNISLVKKCFLQLRLFFCHKEDNVLNAIKFKIISSKIQ